MQNKIIKKQIFWFITDNNFQVRRIINYVNICFYDYEVIFLNNKAEELREKLYNKKSFLNKKVFFVKNINLLTQNNFLLLLKFLEQLNKNYIFILISSFFTSKIKPLYNFVFPKIFFNKKNKSFINIINNDFSYSCGVFFNFYSKINEKFINNELNFLLNIQEINIFNKLKKFNNKLFLVLLYIFKNLFLISHFKLKKHFFVKRVSYDICCLLNKKFNNILLILKKINIIIKNMSLNFYDNETLFFELYYFLLINLNYKYVKKN